MTGSDPKADLHRYLQSAREALPWKLDALALDAIGHVPWWPPDQNEVTRHHILVRVAADTNRHAGQADIIRELIDGTVGLTSESTNLPVRRANERAEPGRERAGREQQADPAVAMRRVRSLN